MWMNSEDARSDFVLVAATAALVPLVRDIVVGLPIYPSSTTPARVLAIGWILLSTLAMPWFLTRYRERPGDAWGGPGERGTTVAALVAASPVLVYGLWRAQQLFGTPEFVVGNLLLELPSPVVGAGPSLTERAIVLGLVGASLWGTLVMMSVLIVRARDGFKQTDIRLVEGLRTFGMGAAAAGLVLGALLALGGRISWSTVLFTTAALVALVLLADRTVYSAMSTTRMALLAPAITSVVLHVFAAGGLLTSDPLRGLWTGALGFGTTIVAATLLETRNNKLAFFALMVSLTLYPTCLHPLSGLQVFASCAA